MWQIGGHYQGGIFLYTPPPPPPLDATPGAGLAYGFRKLRSAYAGSAVRIRRSSDDSEADIGFSGNEFDAAAAAAHIGGGSGFIVTWYDQSGNGQDLTQSTATNQPGYSASSFLGKPSISFDGNDNFLSRAAVAVALWNNAADGEQAAFWVGQHSAPGQGAWEFGGSRCGFLYESGGGDPLRYRSPIDVKVDVSAPVGYANNPHLVMCYRETGGNSALVVDGVQLGTNSGTTDDTSAQTLRIGSLDGFFFQNGFTSEFIIYPSDIGSSARAVVSANVNSYYGIY